MQGPPFEQRSLRAVQHDFTMRKAKIHIVKLPTPVKRRKNFIDRTGARFGRLVVLQFSHQMQGKRDKIDHWLCQCDCGKEIVIQASSLVCANTRSCGCLLAETTSITKRKHGASGTAEHGIWMGMNQRCYNPSNDRFSDYGGRGITVHEPWRTSFSAFFSYVGPRPSLGHSIDRYPNKDGNYVPGNVRWATQMEQMNNTRVNRVVEIDGISHTVSEWMRISGVDKDTISSRLDRGCSPREAVWTLPLPPTKKRGGFPRK